MIRIEFGEHNPPTFGTGTEDSQARERLGERQSLVMVREVCQGTVSRLYGDAETFWCHRAATRRRTPSTPAPERQGPHRAVALPRYGTLHEASPGSALAPCRA